MSGFAKGTDGKTRTLKNPLEGEVGNIALHSGTFDTVVVNPLEGVIKATAGTLGNAIPGSDYARPDTASLWTAPQAGNIIYASDGFFDLSLSNNFVCEPADDVILDFGNLQLGLSGTVLIINSGFVITKQDLVVLAPLGYMELISNPGLYITGFFTDGVYVYLTGSSALE